MDLSLVTSEDPSELSELLGGSGINFERTDALSRARGDFALVSEGGALTPELFRALWEKRAEAEAVVASRYVRGGPGGPIASRFVNRLSRRWLELPCFDLTSCAHLYRTSALRRVVAAETPSGAEILVRLFNSGFRIREVPFRGGVGPERLLKHLASIPSLRRLRFTARTADAEDRAFGHSNRFRRRGLERRQATIVSFLEVDVPVLDVGCGSSRLIQTLSKGVGLDRDPAKIRFLRGRAKAAVCGDLEQLPFRDASFPQVVLADVPTGASDFAEVRRVLKPRGTLVVTSPKVSPAALAERLTTEGFAVDEVRRVRTESIARAVRR